MERRNNDLKLPSITSKAKQASKVLASTMPDNLSRTRPSSLNKVQDLEKKLFSKLDSYEATSKKQGSRRISKKGKVGQCENGGQSITDGYEKLQKVMPALYNKLVQAKKGSLVDLTSIETPAAKNQSSISKRKESATTQATARERSRVSMFITEKEATGFTLDENQPSTIYEGAMSEQEMEEWYRNYSKNENLGVDTSSYELKSLNQGLIASELQIQQLTKSMQGLIRQIGMECLSSFESQMEFGGK